MVAVFQPSLQMRNIVQRESMLKVHVEIIIMHYKIMLFARTSLFIVCFMNISYLFFNEAALLGLPSFEQTPKYLTIKPNSLPYKLSTIWACFEKSSVLRALSTRQIKSFHIVLFKQASCLAIGKETREPFEMSYRCCSSMKNF